VSILAMHAKERENYRSTNGTESIASIRFVASYPILSRTMKLLFIVCLAHWYGMNLVECYYSTGYLTETAHLHNKYCTIDTQRSKPDGLSMVRAIFDCKKHS
jgi:hypothetical protein